MGSNTGPSLHLRREGEHITRGVAHLLYNFEGLPSEIAERSTKGRGKFLIQTVVFAGGTRCSASLCFNFLHMREKQPFRANFQRLFFILKLNYQKNVSAE
jgi:hypothetical protein